MVVLVGRRGKFDVIVHLSDDNCFFRNECNDYYNIIIENKNMNVVLLIIKIMIISTTTTHDHFGHLIIVIIMIITKNTIIILIVQLLFEALIISRSISIIPCCEPNEISNSGSSGHSTFFVVDRFG